MRVLVTGAAGFIGRWVVGELLARGHSVLPVDNLVAGSEANLAEFEGAEGFTSLEVGDVRDARAARRWLEQVDAVAHLAASISVQDSIDDPSTTFDNDVVGTFHLLEAARRTGARFLFMSTCMVYDRATTPEGIGAVAHLAASISVQDSIDDPATTFDNDVVGTFRLLEAARERGARFLFMSTCMVYDRASTPAGISEEHRTKPASPYAASKLAGEAVTLSYGHAYGLPVTVVRPFNTYGPFQRSVGEGGVVAIFTRRSLAGEELRIYGDGTQTRDLLYVSDCARFVSDALLSDAAVGLVLYAGTGVDVSVNDLAAAVEPDAARIVHVPHIHPQSEIAVLRCDPRRAREVLGWRPEVTLEQGLRRVRDWMAERLGAGLPVA